MFRGLINDAKSAAGSLIAKYLTRASVAVPFLVALGFATAATAAMLVERFGTVGGYWIVAGGFTVIGLGATVVMTVKEQEEEAADKKAQSADTAEVTADAVAQAASQAPLALLSALLSTLLGPSALAGGMKMAARNIPLVVLAVALGVLLWPNAPAVEAAEPRWPGPGNKPNGARPPLDEALHQAQAQI